MNRLPTFSAYDQITFSKASDIFTANLSAVNRSTGITARVDVRASYCFSAADEKPDEKHGGGE